MLTMLESENRARRRPSGRPLPTVPQILEGIELEEVVDCLPSVHQVLSNREAADSGPGVVQRSSNRPRPLVSASLHLILLSAILYEKMNDLRFSHIRRWMKPVWKHLQSTVLHMDSPLEPRDFFHLLTAHIIHPELLQWLHIPPIPSYSSLRLPLRKGRG